MKFLLLESKNYMLPCLNKKLLGFECMGCGIQRSVSLIFHGEFLAAFKMYPAIYFLLLTFIIIAINSFKKIKNFNKIITVLSISTVTTIVISFSMKTLIN